MFAYSHKTFQGMIPPYPAVGGATPPHIHPRPGAWTQTPISAWLACVHVLPVLRNYHCCVVVRYAVVSEQLVVACISMQCRQYKQVVWLRELLTHYFICMQRCFVLLPGYSHHIWRWLPDSLPAKWHRQRGCHHSNVRRQLRIRQGQDFRKCSGLHRVNHYHSYLSFKLWFLITTHFIVWIAMFV